MDKLITLVRPYFIPLHKKILIRRSTIVVLPNAFRGSPENKDCRWARNYSTLATPRPCSVDNFKLDPWWVTGFVDGEGSSHVSITENKKFKLGWQVYLKFSIGVHKKDQPVLDEIKKFLHVGSFNWKHGSKTLQFTVISLKDLEAVIKHLQKYPLMIKKCSDFQLIIMVHEKMRRKEHLTLEGLRQIVAIRAAMNRGLS